MRYTALLRGINFGGRNKISMAELKTAFEKQGFLNVKTYINSGNVIFDSDLDESEIGAACRVLIEENFGLNIPVAIISSTELAEALGNAPDWWGENPDDIHNAIFVMPPMKPGDIIAQAGEAKDEHTKTASHGK